MPSYRISSPLVRFIPNKSIKTDGSSASVCHRHASTFIRGRKPSSEPTKRRGLPVLGTTLSFLPGPSNELTQRVIPSPTPTASSLATANNVFTSLLPRFLYSAARFLQIPRNSHVPEVVILGRSNVGKSSLINALAGYSDALRSHGARAKQSGRAHVSATAGATRTMCAYGFGLPMSLPPEAARKHEKEGGRSRSEQRADRKRYREPPPRHSLILVDVPGYGMNSQELWGVEIGKYISRRGALRGAVLLIDAVAGVKAGDKMALELLRDANVRTMVILTKADKLREQQAGLDDVCRKVWAELREAEKASLTWLEGKAWEKEIFVTGVADKDIEYLGVEGARWAICRMAGLVEDKRVRAKMKADPAAEKMVSFDEISRMQERQRAPA